VAEAGLLIPKDDAMINGPGKYTVKTGTLQVTIFVPPAVAP
jgi:hypothetical protein